MGRLLIIVGVLLIAAGFLAPFGASMGGLNSIGLRIPGISEPKESELCSSGETLKKSSSASSRIPGTNTYASSTTYTCVNAQGEARDVTPRFLSGLGREATDFAQGIFGTAMIGTGASLAGFACLFAGIIISIRKGIASGKVRVVTPVYADITNQLQGGSGTHLSGDPSQRLQQLESLYRSRMISESEYESKRKEILRQL
ncbi:MAG: SHOCT domain-containing protein [Deltaproteobacteria bacterium]|nr:SHOCT domain-containing protein [Deltaproteobacteria bacterium]